MIVEGTALIKFTKSEIQLLINSLHMSISTIVPCVDSSEWKSPYKKLKKDLKKIRNQLTEKEREININVKENKTEKTTEVSIEPGPCD